MLRFFSWIILLVVAIAGMPAATLSKGFVENQVATGLDPTAMAVAPDGLAFIAEKAGRIRVVVNDALLTTPFAVLANGNNLNEAGFDGICLHPGFASNGWVYALSCTTTSFTHNRIVRFTANGNVAAGGPTTIFDFETFGGAHHGGALHFAPDGKLSVSTGDTDDSALAQSMTSLQGKALRLNEDGPIPGDGG